MSDALDRLLDSLLYEGYALYPYTPGATKNATPTPFGIVYPPAYARHSESTFDNLRMECELVADPGAELVAEVRFLEPTGERHEAAPRAVVLPVTTFGALAARAVVFESDGLRLTLSRTGPSRVALVVENLSAADVRDRAAALRHSLISTHPLIRVTGGRFVSPLEGGCESVNTWPVLATPDDSVMVGAAIVLPDHPQIAPESRGDLFDATEIEEALLLHVHALSDDERAAIESQDPAVRDMIERAAAAGPDDILALHGRVTVRDPVTREPPTPSAAVRDPTRGEQRAEVDGVVFERGTKVTLRPGADADLHARMLDGRRATIERIFIDYDGRAHLGVTVDDDPGQELMRETGRFLFFFAPEVEVIAP